MDVSLGFDPVGWVLGSLQTLNDFQRQQYEKQADQRNFEYQQQLQNTIFQREDNALQRRMADAQAAGLNPFDVAGSGGAGAGAVVSKNSTPSLPSLGGLVDQYSAIRRLPYEMKELQEGAKQAQAETRIAESNARSQETQEMFNYANTLLSLGMSPSVSLSDNGKINVHFEPFNQIDLAETPFGKNYLNENSLTSGKVSEMEKILQYYDIEESYGMLMPLVELLLNKLIPGSKSIYR